MSEVNPSSADDGIGLLHRAAAAEKLGRFDEARALLRQAIARVSQPEVLDARLRLARLCIMGGPPHYSECESLLRLTRREAEEQSAPLQTAVAVHLLALLYRRAGRRLEAHQLLDSSPVTRQVQTPGTELGQWLHYRGLLLADEGELDQAERLYFRAYEAYRDLGHEPGLREVCDSLANLLQRRGKSQPALRFAKMSLALKQKAGDRYGEAISLGTLGRIYLQQARYDEARRAFLADLAITRELGDQAGIGVALNSLGEVALLQKDFASAQAAYEENATADRGPINAMHAEAGLARLHLATSQLPKAEAACARLDNHLAQHPDAGAMTDILSGLRGTLAWRLGNRGIGEQLIKRAVEELRRRGYGAEAVPFLYELRDNYQKEGETARAVEVMGQALEFWSACGAERGVQDVEDWLRAVDKPRLIRLALERHFPAHLVQDIVQGNLRVTEPRVQQVTVLFCDLRDYTTLAEHTPPKELVELLNEWFGDATLAIQHHHGTVDKFIGDAVMALFGVPEARPDGPAHAVRAALEMRDALCALNLRQKALGGPTLRIGIGIDTGKAVVGFIGSHLRQQYTAIGDVVNSASRLEGLTKEYPGCDILISRTSEEGQQRYNVAETSFVGKVTVKGREQPIEAYRVLGLHQATPTNPCG
jgi:class 3 adenylate cyclase